MLLLAAAVNQWEHATQVRYAGIDFVQFRWTAISIMEHPQLRIYSDEGRNQILESAWDSAQKDRSSRFFDAVQFRQKRSWETFSSPLLYSVFTAVLPRVGTNGVKEKSSIADQAAVQDIKSDWIYGSATYDIELGIYRAVCLASCILGIVCFGLSFRNLWFTCIVASCVMFWFSPLRIDLKVANVNQLQLGMLGILVLTVNRCKLSHGKFEGSIGCLRAKLTDLVYRTDVTPTGSICTSQQCSLRVKCLITGVWLSLCMAFKPNLVFVAGFYSLSFALNALTSQIGLPRRPRAYTLVFFGVGLLIGSLLSLAIASYWFSPIAWVDWIEAVLSMPNDIINTNHGNYSATFFAEHSLSLPKWSLKVGGISLVIATAWILARSRQGDCQVTWMIAGLQIHLLISELVWFHYFVLSLPAFLRVMTMAYFTDDKTQKLFFVTIGLWALLLLGIEPIDRLLRSSHEELLLRCWFANFLLLVTVVSGPSGASAASHFSRCEGG